MMQQIQETEFEMPEAAQLAIRYIRFTNQNIFLTGKAGTGKTTFLKYIRKHAYKQALVAAPTGIAALNAGGVTLHSLFLLPFGGFLPIHGPLVSNEFYKFETYTTLSRHIRMGSTKAKLIQRAELLIIDEVSMVRADILDAIDFVLRFIRRNKSPFGGLQILFIGDLMQLPPVIKRGEWDILSKYYNSPYFFDAQVLKNNTPVYIELEKIYRQSDEYFMEILNRLRHNQLTSEDILHLNTFYKPDFIPKAGEGFIQLCTHNRDADIINQRELQSLHTKAHTYSAEISGEFPENIYPCEVDLQLKTGAQVMFLKNDSGIESRYYNGKIGRIKELGLNHIRILCDDGMEVLLDKYIWENIRYSMDEVQKKVNEDIIGTFCQFPIRLAWAITIHKSQGLSFDKAIVDINKVFASGQAYVALSRLRSLQGLVLSSPINGREVPYDYSLEKFESKKAELGDIEKNLQEKTQSYIKDYVVNTFNFRKYGIIWETHIQSYNKIQSQSIKQNFYNWAKELASEFSKIEKVADTFRVQAGRLFIEKDFQKLQERIQAAANYFLPELKKISAQIYLHLRMVEKLERTKEYFQELELLDKEILLLILQIQKSVCLTGTLHTFNPLDNTQWEAAEDVSWREELKNIRIEIPEILKATPKEKIRSHILTLNALQSGKNLREISQDRSLAISTVYGHVKKLISEGFYSVESLLSPETILKHKLFLEKHKGTGLGILKDIVGNNEEEFQELVLVNTQIRADEMKKNEKAEAVNPEA